MTRDEELYQRNIENFARRRATENGVPADQWEQFTDYAKRRLSFKIDTTEHGYNNDTVQGTCPLDATVEEVKKYFYHDYFGGRAAWVDNGRFGCTIHID